MGNAQHRQADAVEKNLALAYLKASNEHLQDYDGMCGELADEILCWIGDDMGQILYIYPSDDVLGSIDAGLKLRWSYHMVAIIDGLVHDAWFPELILPPEEYIQKAFPGQDLRWEIYK